MWLTAAVVSQPESAGRSVTARSMTSSARRRWPERLSATRGTAGRRRPRGAVRALQARRRSARWTGPRRPAARLCSSAAETCHTRVELQRPLQVQGCDVALPHRLVAGLATVRRPDGVGGHVVGQGELVETQMVIADGNSGVGVLGDHAVLDAAGQLSRRRPGPAARCRPRGRRRARRASGAARLAATGRTTAIPGWTRARPTPA